MGHKKNNEKNRIKRKNNRRNTLNQPIAQPTTGETSDAAYHNHTPRETISAAEMISVANEANLAQGKDSHAPISMMR